MTTESDEPMHSHCGGAGPGCSPPGQHLGTLRSAGGRERQRSAASVLAQVGSPVPVHQRELDAIDTGSPWQNAWIENLNRRLRDERLNGHLSDSLPEAKVLTEQRGNDVNVNRRHR